MALSSTHDLGKGVLRDVSRSFYLTLRALPKGMRAATSVGYLLARASDTIADCGGPRAERVDLLETFRQALAREPAPDFFTRAAALADEPGLKDGERVLMRRLEEAFQWLEKLQPWEQKAVREVVETIISGQRWDLERFPEGELVALEDEEEALTYCYQVAGCVGEFWTRVGFGSNSRFARQPEATMKDLGRRYGMGLQMINILRDESEDAERGRRYLPGERAIWMGRARENLEAGLDYARAVRPWRARFATVLPTLIGLRTLDLLADSTPEELTKGVKVSRAVVKSCLREALFFR